MSTFVDVICAVRRNGSLCALVLRQQKGWDRGRRVTCTCWLSWLSVEMTWLALGGPILALFAQIQVLQEGK